MKPLKRLLVLMTVALVTPGAAWVDASAQLSKSDQRLYERAFAAADGGRWAAAQSTASQARDKLPAKVIRWMHMTRRDSTHRFEDIARFINANPDWPGIKSLRRNAERAMDSRIPAHRVRDWFAVQPPLTTEGRVRHIEALLAGGRESKAAALVKSTWRTGSFGRKQGDDFRRKYKKISEQRRSRSPARPAALEWPDVSGTKDAEVGDQTYAECSYCTDILAHVTGRCRLAHQARAQRSK